MRRRFQGCSCRAVRLGGTLLGESLQLLRIQ